MLACLTVQGFADLDIWKLVADCMLGGREPESSRGECGSLRLSVEPSWTVAGQSLAQRLKQLHLVSAGEAELCYLVSLAIFLCIHEDKCNSCSKRATQKFTG